jgi:hypothetical protein
MKNLGKISSLILVIAMSLIVSCESEKLVFKGPYFVRFTDTALTLKESHIPVVKIQVHYSNPDRNDGDVNLTYVVSGSAREGIDYVINGTRGKIKIKSGDYFGYIEVQLINNSNNILSSQDVTFSLVTAEKGDQVFIGQGVSQLGKDFTLTIQDDCILGGDYYGLNDDGSAPVDNINISSLNCEQYTLSNYDIDPFSITEHELSFIDNGDNTLTIPPQQDELLDADSATIDGFGIVDPVTRKLHFTVRFPGYAGKRDPVSFQLIPD